MATWRKAGAIMTFRKNELAAVEKALPAFLQRKRPLEHVRSKVDIGFKISGQSIELVEIRPHWDKPSVHKPRWWSSHPARTIRVIYRTTAPPGTKSLNSDGDVPCSDKDHLDEKSTQNLNMLGITERALLNLHSITDENLLHILAKTSLPTRD
jgi:hypothetical protein